MTEQYGESIESSMSPEEHYKLAKLDIATAAQLNDHALTIASELDEKSVDQVRIIATLSIMTQEIVPRQLAHMWAEMVYREMVRNRES